MNYYTEIASPLGRLLLTGDERFVTGLSTEGHGRRTDGAWIRDDERFEDVIGQLDRYWNGERVTFRVPVAPRGTPFQLKVWAALQQIPYGTTVTYGELARTIGHPRAVRAAGSANSRNPISIIVPCHRVIGADGSLTGYAGGLERKSKLLSLEGAHYAVL